MEFFKRIKMEMSLPKELRHYIKDLKKTEKINSGVEAAVMVLECESRDMYKQGLISEEQWNYIRYEYLFG